jgi:TetR/AcrR family transcriptional regulator, mexJK operon transcriptional repressor
VEIVRSVTNEASHSVHNEMPDLAEREDVADYLRRYADRQLTIVLTPRVMQLRRLVSWRSRPLP